MSFLTERTVRAVLPMCRSIAVQAPRAFSTSPALRKNPVESVKDGLKTVDRAVTDNVVLPGLEAAASAGNKVKEGAETVTKGNKGKVDELKGQVQGEAEVLKGQAKGAAAAAQGKAKGAAENLKNKL
ncbi:hypothetical protein C2857_001433 [Epichloe festucae Fl1]|uniref:Lea domain protein n=1 Tax=Epichloe festucae (strain Fl1) TaxID=877507 RepID=A0A7S9KK03_EPIFF|nr:hypothetical protein C2857_001433 [Epichloe festucae Fl1]